MRAVVATEPGGPEVLTVGNRPDPHPGHGEVVLDVAASAVNRADLLQRQGHYPPPPGASDVLGLECSGTVCEVGPGVERWQVGDEVCALLSGGGYAEQVLVPAGQVMAVPDGVDLVTPAAPPEGACTVWSNLFMVAGHRPGGPGADVVLDNMGASYLARNLEVLATEGRLVVIGTQGGTKAELDLGMLLRKRAAVVAATLRARPAAEKAAICAAVEEHVWPLVADGSVRPVVHTRVPLAEAGRAHAVVEESS